MAGKTIYDHISDRILVLDGGLGTMVQSYGLGEKDYSGKEFADWPVTLKGFNDILVITAPHILEQIHGAYLEAGADIISTDTFNANGISAADYGLQEYVYEINRTAAELARRVADKFSEKDLSKPRYAAGSIGPTSKTASIAANIDNMADRDVDFETLAAAYAQQAGGLIDGGVDLFIIETIFDTLNAKAAVFAIQAECEKRGKSIPVIISGTLGDASGRTLSGQTVEAFYTSLIHARPLAIGFNCAFGAKQLMPYLERMAAVSEFPVSVHPNAGLPNMSGGYDETPEMMAADVEEYMRRGLVNIVGGCCGTTPRHIELIARAALKYKPRRLPEFRHQTVLSGLEPLKITREGNFVNVGERTNVAGSAKFARMIREDRYEEALSVARQQVEAGAQIIDVCMDDGLIDGPAAMKRFLNFAMSEPEVARVPVMIDSSSWETLRTGLQCVQGKSIVNSVSLKEGVEEFVRKARMVRRYGAAVIVMLFDERGQADTYDRKIEVAEMAYGILTGMGFPPEDIIFDPNVLAVATGIPEHDNYGVDFIEAVRWIKKNLPYAKVSGGISNLSFAFRGNNKVREAMHSVFLFHAIAAGMDMGIVNPAMLQVYSDIEPELLELSEDVVLNRRPDAAERLAAYAEKDKGINEDAQRLQSEKWRTGTATERMEYAMTKGVTDHIAEDVMEAYRESGSPLGVIDTVLMPAMSRIGELFGEGKMFLPQVVKSARVMRRAVDVLTPFMDRQEGPGTPHSAGKILIATVKGDVHDIGKNIVSVVMSCNGYDVKDLGVMVEGQIIIDTARDWGADAICLSGLISPSLDEMIRVVEELQRRRMTVPVVIGGATTSKMHTAVKIAPHYNGVVIHSRDASENVGILNKLLDAGRDKYIAQVKERQAGLRDLFERNDSIHPRISIQQARENGYRKTADEIIPPLQTGKVVFSDYSVAEVVPYIDWNFFFPAWQIKGRYPEILDSPEKGSEARKLLDDAQSLLGQIERDGLLRLNGVTGIYRAFSESDDIIVDAGTEGLVRLPQLRNQEGIRTHDCGKGCVHGTQRPENLSLADFVMPGSSGKDDYMGVFAVTAGIGLKELAGSFRKQGDEYSAIMAKLLADRLTEAFAEAVHSFVRRAMWGYETGPVPAVADIIRGKYQGIRTAFGYPACPDHSLKKEVFGLLDVPATTSMKLTENYMIDPGEALCGLMFAGKEAHYFSVGRIGRDQLEDYALRRGVAPEEIARLISQHLG